MTKKSESEKLVRFYYKKSRLQQLKGFCLTAQLNSVSKAAKKMGLGTSTVSMQIKSLEDDLKIELFNRDKKNGISLTEKGQQLYDISIKYVYGIDNIFEKFLFLGDLRYQNKINIASSEVIISNLLPHTIAKFKKKYPNIDIILHNITKKECKERILDKRIDIGIYPFSPEEKLSVDFKITKYKDYILYFIVSKNHELAQKPDKDISAKDIADSNFAYVPEPTPDEFKQFLKKHKIKNSLSIENPTPRILKKMVNEDLCTAYIPEIYCMGKNKNMVIKNLSIDLGYRDYYYGILIREDNKKEIIEVLTEMLVKQFKD